jgi:phospholipase C
MMAYDDWGGWYDHVVPPTRSGHTDGFRVPAVLISPYARQHYIDHTSLDFTSLLKFTEQNWHLRPLTQLDASAGSIMEAFDFGQPPRKPEIIPLQRTATPPAQTVRDVLLYALYGLGVAFAAALIVMATRRRRLRLAPVRPESGPA